MSVGVRYDTIQILIVRSRVDMLEDKFAEPLIAIYQCLQSRKLDPPVGEHPNDSVRISFSWCSFVARRVSLKPIVNLFPSLQIVGLNLGTSRQRVVAGRRLSMDGSWRAAE
jgi:hypothetical protein